MCHLMKRYTQVTIIRLDTGASGMYRIPASGGRHLGNMVLPPPASLSHFSSRSLSVYLSIQQNSTRGLLDLHRLIAHLTCVHIFDTIEGQVRDSLESEDCFPAVCCLLCQSPSQRVNITMNVNPLLQLMQFHTAVNAQEQSSTRNSN